MPNHHLHDKSPLDGLLDELISLDSRANAEHERSTERMLLVANLQMALAQRRAVAVGWAVCLTLALLGALAGLALNYILLGAGAGVIFAAFVWFGHMALREQVTVEIRHKYALARLGKEEEEALGGTAGKGAPADEQEEDSSLRSVFGRFNRKG